MVVKIPKKLHRIWLGGKPIPTWALRFQRQFERLHPDWETVWWNEWNLPRKTYYNFYGRSNNPMYRIELLRWEILSQHGGLHADLDFQWVKSIDGLCEGSGGFIATNLTTERRVQAESALVGMPSNMDRFFELALYGFREHMERYKSHSPVSTAGVHYWSVMVKAWNSSAGFDHQPINTLPPEYFFPFNQKSDYAGVPMERDIESSVVAKEFPHAYAVHRWRRDWELDTPGV